MMVKYAQCVKMLSMCVFGTLLIQAFFKGPQGVIQGVTQGVMQGVLPFL